MRQKGAVLKTGMPQQCQCDPKCGRTAPRGKIFCHFHENRCGRTSPLSGYEPQYDPGRWNRKVSVRETHNCFSYAMNVQDPKQIRQCEDDEEECDAPFHQPGSAAGYRPFSSKRYKTCPNMVLRLLGDNPDMSMTTFESRCPPHTSKIALVVDPKEDYHFLRQDSNMYWSQKSGARPITNLDALGHLIYDPQLANLKYKTSEGLLDYSVFCGYMCVPRDSRIFLQSGGVDSIPASPSALTRPFRTRSTRRRS